MLNHAATNRHLTSHDFRRLVLLPAISEGQQRDQQELSLRVILGASLIAAKGYGAPEVEPNFLAAKALSESLGDIDLAGAIWLGLHRNHVAIGDVHAAHDGDKAFYDFAISSGHRRAIVTANWGLGSSSMWLGLFQQAAPLLRAAYENLSLEDEKEFLTTHMESPGVTCRDFSACTDVIMGYPDQALEKVKVSRDLAEKLGNPFAMAFGHCMTSQIYAWRQEAEPSSRHAEAAIALCDEFDLPLWRPVAIIFRGTALAQLGHKDDALACLADDDLIDAMPTLFVLAPSYLVRMAEAELWLGELAAARRAIDLAFEMGAKVDEGWTLADRHRVRAALMAVENPSDQASAEAEYLTALSIADSQGAKWFELEIAVALARLWQSQGKPAEARDVLSPIYDWFSEGFETPKLVEAKSLLNELG